MISFRCNNDLRKALEQKAKQRGISTGELIRQILIKQLEHAGKIHG
ncbi:MAG: ribbon-helix-helix protein, CopG family [Caulobacteraceae bacterium]|nr:ribbon-helix-helix protein, CopG family [Caulobacteraceae bacterium]